MPFEGRNSHCDAGPGGSEAEGVDSFPFSLLFAFAHQAKASPFSVFIPPFISKRCSTIVRSCTSSYLLRFTKFSVLTFPFTLSLCDLCVSKDNQRFIFHAESAKSAKFYFPLCFTLALEWSQTSLRQKCAESFIHPLPPCGVLPPVSGGESG